MSDLLRAPSSGLDLAAVDTRATPNFDGGKTAGREVLPEIGEQLFDLQEKLYANGRTGGDERVRLAFCRAWTRPARAGRSATCWGR